jgi:hypothetical protein
VINYEGAALPVEQAFAAQLVAIRIEQKHGLAERIWPLSKNGGRNVFGGTPNTARGTHALPTPQGSGGVNPLGPLQTWVFFEVGPVRMAVRRLQGAVRF